MVSKSRPNPPTAPGRRAVALEVRLRSCKNVTTLGVRPNFDDYPEAAAELIRRAPKIYYPGSRYADLLHAMGKPIFPSLPNYRFAQDKIMQTALFQLLCIPHPTTRVFYGPRQKRRIGAYFRFPFVAKIPRGSAMGRGVFLIRNNEDLQRYLQVPGPAYIQEYLPVERDIRVVVIGERVRHAYWRKASGGDFRCNVAAGGRILLEPVPPPALALAESTARRCGWNDVGIDVCTLDGAFYVLEANMKYGREGFRTAGIDYAGLMEDLIDDEEI
jgi:ribosomal protein S6--L-glutamate ligase